MERAETRYARSGDVMVAYQITDRGAPIDLVIAPGTVSHLDMDWEPPEDMWWLERLAPFCRVIRFDKRGTGLSDRVVEAASLEERTDDIRAVMDAAGSESAVVWGVSEGGSMALVFAATYPKRTRALIVEGGQARWVRAPDMPWGIGEDEYRRVIDELAEHGVTESYIRGWGGGYGAAAGPDTIESLMRYFRAGASPASIAALERMNMAIDVREILPSIAVPTLIINGTNDPVSPIEGARYLAEAIPGARLHEYESDTHLASSREQGEALLDAVVEFMTGTRPPPRIDRVLATVLFTDIVDSTKTAAELGDARWRELLAQHDAIAREEIARSSGRYVESTGDGLLATFDGPARAVRCAQAIAQGVHSVGLRIRAGCHTGEMELAGEAIRGVAVHIGARVAALAGPDDVWTSSTVKDLTVGSGLVFEDEGEHELKGVPGPWHLYRAVR